MPRGKMNTVPAIFEEFVTSLGALIKEKAAEAVLSATNDFFAAKFGSAAKKGPKPGKKARGRRGRPKGSKAKAKAKPAVENKTKPAAEHKPA